MQRRHRTDKQSTGKRVAPSPLSEKVFLLLQRYRYLPTTHIHAHVGGHKLYLQHHLTDLYHETDTPHGGRYLDRPQQRLQFANHFYRPETYENTARAFAHLKDRGLFEPLAYKLTHIGRNSTHREFPHEVMACEVLSSIELGAREVGVAFIPEHNVLDRAPSTTRDAESPFTFILDGARLTPDRMFGLRYGDGRARFFAVEVDRSTMPLTRSGEGSSYGRKLASYQRLVTSGTHVAHLGIPNLVVLTITTNVERMRSMLDLAATLGSPNYFAFKALPDYGRFMRTPPPLPSLLTEPWRREGHPDILIGAA